eukprot:COSAG01_NODE_13991_length_1510_cov_1.386960_3_plen_62_part_00
MTPSSPRLPLAEGPGVEVRGRRGHLLSRERARLFLVLLLEPGLVLLPLFGRRGEREEMGGG